ncbi:MAG TPA: hypothetical protein EYP53_01515 [Candidatus Latescibacteria bacterium]|nr:hypothetical protein [Candidatus Latescibacterota bacterium]
MMSDMPRIGIDLSGNPALLILYVLLSVVTVYLLYRGIARAFSKKVGWVLGGLRLLVLSLMLFLLMEPILTLRTTHIERPTVALLVDRSESIGLVDRKGSRYRTLLTLLKGDALNRLRADYSLRSFSFADDLSEDELTSADSLRIEGRGTDIGNALRQLRSNLEGQRLSAIVLLSDGANNLGPDPIAVAKEIGLPVYTVGIGDPEGPGDIAISKVIYSEIAYAKSQVPVDVTVQSWGYKGLRIPVVLVEGNNELERQHIELAGEGREQLVSFTLSLEEPGLHRYRVRIVPQADEISKENNSRIISIRVLKGRIRVLLISGGPSPDLAFLKGSLEGNEEVKAELLVVKAGRDFYSGNFPVSIGQMRGFDLVILLNLPYRALTGRREQLLLDFVGDGGALLVIGGNNSFGAGGYAGSPLADVFPLSMESGSKSFQEGEFRLEVTTEGWGHPIFSASDVFLSNGDVWEQMPPLLGINRCPTTKPGARVLARTKEARLPLIALGDYGRGKVMVVAFSSFWRWDLMMWGMGSTNRVSQEFWRNVVLWLGRGRLGETVEISTDRLTYRGGETVTFSGKVYGMDGTPRKDAKIIVSLTTKDQEHRKLMLESIGNGVYQAQLQGLGPGEYAFKGEAWAGDRRLGQDTGEFIIGEYSLESGQPKADFRLLEELARGSGGRFYRAEEFSRLPGDLNLKRKRTVISSRFELWNRPWLLGLFVGLLTAEWIIRKKKGLL